MIRVEVDCGEGRETLRLGVVMVGAAARELGARLRAGATVSVSGALRAARGREALGLAARGVEVVASEIREIAGAMNR